MEKTNFNEIIENLITNAITSEAIKSELVIQDRGYQFTMSLIRLEDDEE